MVTTQLHVARQTLGRKHVSHHVAQRLMRIASALLVGIAVVSLGSAACYIPASPSENKALHRRLAVLAPVLGISAPAVAESTVQMPSDSLQAASGLTTLLKPFFASEATWQAGEYDRKAVQARIDAETNSAPVVVYTYALSPFCTQAIDLLKSLGAKYKVVELGAEWLPGLLSSEGAAVRAELGALTGQTSLPSVWIDGSFVGGLFSGPGLVPLLESGKLMKKLKDANAI